MSYLIFIVGLLIGWKFREYTAVRKINKMLRENAEKSEKVEQNKITVKIEKHNDIFYLFNTETNEFLTQGKDKEEIQTNLKLRFQNVNMAFHATAENIKEIGFK